MGGRARVRLRVRLRRLMPACAPAAPDACACRHGLLRFAPLRRPLRFIEYMCAGSCAKSCARFARERSERTMINNTMHGRRRNSKRRCNDIFFYGFWKRQNGNIENRKSVIENTNLAFSHSRENMKLAISRSFVLL